jgi:signal recognition particle subunit SRP9
LRVVQAENGTAGPEIDRRYNSKSQLFPLRPESVTKLELIRSEQCIMYKSFSSIILNRFESLNVRLLSQIANSKPRIRTSATPGPSTEIGVGGEDDPMLGTAEKGRERSGTPAVGAGGSAVAGAPGAGGGGKKKKKGKR